MDAAAIRDELRNADNENITRRRKIIALSALGLLDFTVISLYQSGIIKKLPDVHGGVFDSNAVNGAKDAYKMGTPDATISLCIYAATITLAALKGTEESGRTRVHDMVLGTVIAANAGGALYYLSNMIFKQKKLCLYCLTGAAINITSAIIAAPLFIKGIKKLFNQT